MKHCNRLTALMTRFSMKTQDVSTFLDRAHPSSLVVTVLIVPAARDQVIMGD